MQSIDPGHQGPTELNSTTSVEICAAPASGKRRQVIGIHTTNLDTATGTAILEMDVSGTKSEVDRVAIPPGATDSSMATRDRPIHLAATTHSLTMKLSGAVAATQPKVNVEFLESTD